MARSDILRPYSLNELHRFADAHPEEKFLGLTLLLMGQANLDVDDSLKYSVEEKVNMKTQLIGLGIDPTRVIDLAD